ncbi:MAG: hypothetical protein M3Z09_09040 [Acidobacteriota bacterium]|nr:hypothetical protein [Acidobacteriota bacterium]
MADLIAIVGSETLIGREIRDALAESRMGYDVRLIAAPGEEAGKLTEAGGEPAVIAKLDPAAFERVEVTVLAGSCEAALQVAGFGLPGTLIDMSYCLEGTPQARLRAPLVEPHDFRVPHDAIQVIAHPASIAIALLLSRVHPVFPISRTVAHVFEPASERGTAGVEELQGQSVSLLAFRPLPKAVYDAQLSYSMLARFGEDAPVALEEIETRIERHLATLLSNSGQAPVPSLRLVQAPVFHGYSFSLWIEFEQRPAIAALEQILKETPVDLRESALEPPNNVGVAGQSGIAVGAISADRNSPRAFWLWMAADNLKLMADNALQVIQEVL